MSETRETNCPECTAFDRRDLLRYVSIAPAAVAAGAMMAPSIASAEELPAPRTAKPGGELVKELYSTMTDEQKKQAVKPWNHAARLSVNPNRALDKTIGNVFNAKQQELIEKIVKS